MFKFDRTQIETIKKAWVHLEDLAKQKGEYENLKAGLSYERKGFEGGVRSALQLAKATMIIEASHGIEKPEASLKRASTSLGLCWARVFGASLKVGSKDGHQCIVDFQTLADHVAYELKNTIYKYNRSMSTDDVSTLNSTVYLRP